MLVDYRVNPRNPPLTVVIQADEQDVLDKLEPHMMRAIVHDRLGLSPQFDRRWLGVVHSWRYSNGSVRYTFQPDLQ